MKTGKVSICKASPTRDPIDSVMIDIVDEIPHDLGTLERHRALYEHDARELFDALKGSLPGGTMDALLRLLLEHRASLLRVTSHP